MYSCCGGNGASQGCLVGKHVEPKLPPSMALSAAAEEHLRVKKEQAKAAELAKPAEQAIETSGEEGDGNR